MRTLFGIAFALTIAVLCACNKDRKPSASDPAHIARIKVNRDGTILLNGQIVTMDVLKASLSKLTQSGDAAVWYYRENSAGEPHPNAMLVLQAAIDTKLPIKLSSKPDFSDSVGPGNVPPSTR